MKKKLNPHTAFFNSRVAIALTLCLTGVLIALGGTGGHSTRPKAQAQTRARSIAPPTLVPMVGPASLDQDLRTLPYVAPKQEFEEQRLMRYPHNARGPEQFDRPGVAFRTVKRLLAPPRMPGPLLTFDGINSA